MAACSFCGRVCKGWTSGFRLISLAISKFGSLMMVKAKRAEFIVRIAPDLAKWATQAGKRAGVSRTGLVEGWIEVLRDVLEETARFEEQHPGTVVVPEMVGAMVVDRLRGLGLASEAVEVGWAFYLDEQRALLAGLMEKRPVGRRGGK